MIAAEKPLVSFTDVALGYPGKTVLSGLDFCVCRGDFLGIVGPNGAGKTTILRGVLGLLKPQRGQVSYHAPEGHRRFHFGYVPQRETVDEGFPLDALDVVLMGRYRRIGRFRRPGAADRQAAREALEAAGVARHADAPFRTLSGGQKQRVLIARALVTRPDLLVLDEPTSGMDLLGESSVMRLVDRLHREQGLTIVMVSHQLNTVLRWVHRLGFLHEGHLDVGPQGEVLTPEVLEHVYGKGADVVEVNGHRMVLPPEEPA